MAPFRYAIYFAPAPGAHLWRLGSDWLGYDAFTGAPRERPSVAGVQPSLLPTTTAEPARYGFHATLKPPFRPRHGANLQDLLAAAKKFAGIRSPITLSGLEVAEIGNFIALRPVEKMPELDALAASCVEIFDPWRSPATEDELDRRRAVGLTPREEVLLQRWGYPYVMDMFRFHMTLTGKIGAAERTDIRRALTAYFESVTGQPFSIDAIAVFAQPSPDSPFRALERFPLRAGA